MLLSNRQGSYFSASNNQTSYQGLTIFRKNEMYKLVDAINFSGEIKEIINIPEQDKFIIKRNHNSSEEYFLSDVLECNINDYQDIISIDLDFRFLYDVPKLGRIYNIRIEEDNKKNNQDNNQDSNNVILIIEYNKYNNEKLEQIKDKYFLAIKINNIDHDSLKIENKWVPKEYSINKKRGETPTYYVNRAISFKLKNSNGSIIVSFAGNESKAKEKLVLHSKAKQNNKSFYANYHNKHKHIEDNEDQHYFIKTKYSAELKAIYNSLDINIHQILLKDKHQVKQIFAGWPWFFQFWTRDSLISLGALILTRRFTLVKKILDQYLNLENNKGLISSRIPMSKLGSIDSTGWLFKRYYDFIYSLAKLHKLNEFYNHDELILLKKKLEKIFNDFVRNNMKNGLIYSGKKETWMDTDYNDSGRQGYCIEIQALTLAMIKTLRGLSLLTNTKSIKRYRDIETKLLLNTRKKFYKNGMIADYITDKDKCFVQRPNIFLARYVYPHLFSNEEWKKAFEFALEKLWLNWGGLSSIDKTNENFTPTHTGITNKSYHRGDSWYFINNITATQLFDVDKNYFAVKIRMLFDASIKDLFFTGVIGGCAEISSAAQQTSEGCLNQSWSSATLIELLYLLENKNMFFED